jgi:hypothetical protein
MRARRPLACRIPQNDATRRHHPGGQGRAPLGQDCAGAIVGPRVTSPGIRPSFDAGSRRKGSAHVADDQIPFEVRPLAGAPGAEIFGVDLDERLDDPAARAVRTALLQPMMILFRDQQLTPPQLPALAERFGEVGDDPLIKGLPECPLMPIIEEPHERVNFGGIWFRTRPIPSAPRTRQGWPPGPQPSGRLAGDEVPHLE